MKPVAGGQDRQEKSAPGGRRVRKGGVSTARYPTRKRTFNSQYFEKATSTRYSRDDKETEGANPGTKIRKQ